MKGILGMLNSIFWRSISILVLCFGICMPTAMAQLPQNTLPSTGTTVFEEINGNQVVAMLVGIGVQAQINQPSDGGIPNVIAQSPSGGRFYVDLVACDDDAQMLGCNSMLMRAAMSNAGVSYEDLNRFNSEAVVATAINIAQRNLIFFGRHSIVAGGVRTSQMQIQTALFLNDMDTYVAGQGSSTSVSLDTSTTGTPLSTSKVYGSKIDGLGTQVDTTTRFGKNVIDAALTDSAIFNTYSVRFLTPEAKALLELAQ